jgi:hypothetical protein
MALLPFTTRNFTGPVAASGNLPLSLEQLIWAAVTVGATPISLGARPRPLAEVSWRSALAAANVAEDPSANRWVKTDAYWRLDPSEKSAVSYFLGMTQAKFTCAMLLGVPHLIHLDAVLALHGRTTKESRPDFIGFDFASRTYTVAVEAKGRTHGRTDAVTEKAKEQAGLLPSIVSTSSTLQVASVASFDTDGCWQAYLEDPPGAYQAVNQQTIEGLLVAYYRPLVSALLAAGINENASDDATAVAQLPGMDMYLGLPHAIVTALHDMSPTGPVPAGELESAGAILASFLRDLPGGLSDPVPDQKSSPPESSTDNQTFYTGLDGLYVALGPSWYSTAAVLP